jgi:predicted lipoprotein with Yx(FWY)xxD motif
MDEHEGAIHMRTMTRVLPLLMAGGLLLAACGDDASTAADDTTSTTADTTTTAPATVALVTSDALGAHLVGPNGHTLYLFEKDQGTTTACTAGCTGNWPALTADGGLPTAGTGVDAGKLSTADGQQPNQVVYAGHLLYYFAGDAEPGDTNGTKVASWYAVSPAGTAIELDEASDATTATTRAPAATTKAPAAPATTTPTTKATTATTATTTPTTATTADDDGGYGY